MPELVAPRVFIVACRTMLVLTNRVAQRLLPVALIALGSVLLATFYLLDYPNANAGAFPAHAWSTAGAVAAWWVLLAGLGLLAGSPGTVLLALLSAIALGNVSRDYTGWFGAFGAAIVLVAATSAAVIRSYGWRGRLAGSLILGVIGSTTCFLGLNGYFSSTPVLGGPVGMMLGVLIACPAVIGIRSAIEASQTRISPQASPVTQQVSERPKPSWLAGFPYWGWVYLLGFVWAVNIPAKVLLSAGIPNVVAYAAGIVVVAAVIAAALVLRPRVESWLDAPARLNKPSP